MKITGSKKLYLSLVLSVLAAAPAAAMQGLTQASTEDGILTIQFANGIYARVFTSEYLEARVIRVADRGVLQLDDKYSITLLTNIDDPAITNKGDGQFHPFDEDLVVQCLGQIDYPDLELSVEIYVLPYPRLTTLASSASGNRIFLSPHVLEISKEGSAYIVAHELGHVFQHRYLPDPDYRGWTHYRHIRHIEDEEKFSSSSPHAYRPHEIFAEDFRVLFGGPWAYFGGRVENHELVSPVHVAGLETFFLSLTTTVPKGQFVVSFNGFPNPFNPETELRINLTDDFIHSGQPMTVRIYDVTGALVRELYGGRPNTAVVQVVWDGRDQRGNQVASATYFGVVQAGESRMTTKLMMLK
ncbi:MAG: hypothetical protein JSW50_10240 [Candidatus Latescibacterota bacterium]|nr:MAG: hypothetical protein JSW50_10240 [Candidatus Latescibacterota bacterium]